MDILPLFPVLVALLATAGLVVVAAQRAPILKRERIKKQTRSPNHRRH